METNTALVIHDTHRKIPENTPMNNRFNMTDDINGS